MTGQPSLFEEPLEGGGWIPLRGLAQNAAGAAELEFRNDVTYRELPCRSVVTPCSSPRMPFQFTLNPYRGCEFGCVYCYARYTHEFLEYRDWLDFERRIFVKRGAREALVADLRRLDLRGKWIAIGTATDPYQPAERRFRLTRSLLGVLAERRGLRLSITTKSDLVARDVDLLARIHRGNALHVNVTITTPHYQLARRIEPRAPRPDRRLRAVRILSDAGIRCGVFAMPLLPRVNDRLDDLNLLCRQAREAGAEYLAAQVLFLRSCSRKRFFPFLQERFPDLLPFYRRLYAADRTEALESYSRRLHEQVEWLKRRHGLTGDRREVPAPREEQLSLDDLILQAQPPGSTEPSPKALPE